MLIVQKKKKMFTVITAKKSEHDVVYGTKRDTSTYIFIILSLTEQSRAFFPRPDKTTKKAL